MVCALLQGVEDLTSCVGSVVSDGRVGGSAKCGEFLTDLKDFGIGAQILHDLGISKIKLLSNSEEHKRVGMIGYGLEIADRVHY